MWTYNLCNFTLERFTFSMDLHTKKKSINNHFKHHNSLA